MMMRAAAVGFAACSRTARTAAALFALLSFALPSAAETFRVGADAACDQTSLATAVNLASLNGPGEDTILVADNQTYTAMALTLVNTSALIRGGYSTCAEPTPIFGARTVIDGAGAPPASVLEISSSVEPRRTVTLENLRFRGGEDDIDDGGGLEIGGNVKVNLINTEIRENQSEYGGGIHISGGQAELDLSVDSQVSTNTATLNGGGVYCEAGARVTLRGAVWGNSAVDGGGVYADGCEAHVWSGDVSDDGIDSNAASGNGGGVYLVDTTAVFQRQATVSINDADGDGGGLYLTGAGTVVTAAQLDLGGNQALGDGGGILVTSGASLDVSGPGSCPDDGCANINDNQSALFGGALAVTGGASASVRRSYLNRNIAAAGSGGYVEGAGSTLSVEGAVITGSSGATVFQAGTDGWLQLAMVSTQDNLDGGFFASAQGTGSTVRVLSSIIWEDSGQVLHAGPSTTTLADCLIVHENSSVSGISISVQDPQYVDFDLHIGPTSPAIDYCDDAIFSPTVPDIDFDARGLDAPDPNLFGPFDLGFDEFNPALIFADGFESGG